MMETYVLDSKYISPRLPSAAPGYTYINKVSFEKEVAEVAEDHKLRVRDGSGVVNKMRMNMIKRYREMIFQGWYVLYLSQVKIVSDQSLVAKQRSGV